MAGKHAVIRAAPSFYITMALAIILLPMHWIVAWLTAVIVHEGGHLVASLLCGAKIRGVYITPTGAIIETDGLTPGKQIITSLAGPAAGLCLLLLSRWIPLTATLAMVHSLFNLLPIMYLDGSVVLYNALCLLCAGKRNTRICRVADTVSRIVLACLSLIVAWELSWAFAVIFTVLLLIRSKRNPCKRGVLQVE